MIVISVHLIGTGCHHIYSRYFIKQKLRSVTFHRRKMIARVFPEGPILIHLIPELPCVLFAVDVSIGAQQPVILGQEVRIPLCPIVKLERSFYCVLHHLSSFLSISVCFISPNISTTATDSNCYMLTSIKCISVTLLDDSLAYAPCIGYEDSLNTAPLRTTLFLPAPLG